VRLVEIEVKSFKGVKRAVVPLGDTTVLVGANNAGKSSVLQAVHFAARAMALAADANKQSTLPISELEYLPTNSYRQLGHNTNWGNAWNMPESEVIFKFKDDQGTIVKSNVKLKSARNEGLSIDPRIPPLLFPKFRYNDTPFSAYIPGIAGIPLEEQKLTTRHIYRKAASGDSNVVLRNILLLIKHAGKIEELISFVRGVYPFSHITVTFNEKTDLSIKAEFISGDSAIYRPIEFAGNYILEKAS
jgi:AAA ATPase domain